MDQRSFYEFSLHIICAHEFWKLDCPLFTINSKQKLTTSCPFGDILPPLSVPYLYHHGVFVAKTRCWLKCKRNNLKWIACCKCVSSADSKSLECVQNFTIWWYVFGIVKILTWFEPLTGMDSDLGVWVGRGGYSCFKKWWLLLSLLYS